MNTKNLIGGGIRTLVVDDEPIACKLLEWFLKNDPEVEIVGICTNGKEALKAIREKRPDLVFLDIQMPGWNGFDLLNDLPQGERPHLIFVTAYDRYAVRAFDFQAIDYLLKPFDEKRFRRGLERAKEQIRGRKQLALLQNSVRGKKGEYLHRLELKYSGRVYFIPVQDICWMKAADQYVDVHCEKQSYLIRVSMNWLERKMDPADFVRIHRSAIVNVNYIKEADLGKPGHMSVLLKDGTVLSLSRRRVAALRKLLLPASRIRTSREAS
jgi:two-component system LytT family response regulator